MSELLSVAQIIDDTEAEGPGRRFAVWVQGCPLRCPGCCNPQMLRFEGGRAVDAIELAARALRVKGIAGVTLLGGEPFAQATACALFARAARERGLDVMVFTGFTWSELEEKRARAEPGIEALVGACDLLVDGPYVRECPENGRRWIGSTNQTMHFLSDRYHADDPIFRTANTVEIRLRKGELVINGWPALARQIERGR